MKFRGNLGAVAYVLTKEVGDVGVVLGVSGNNFYFFRRCGAQLCKTESEELSIVVHYYLRLRFCRGNVVSGFEIRQDLKIDELMYNGSTTLTLTNMGLPIFS